MGSLAAPRDPAPPGAQTTRHWGRKNRGKAMTQNETRNLARMGSLGQKMVPAPLRGLLGCACGFEFSLFRPVNVIQTYTWSAALEGGTRYVSGLRRVVGRRRAEDLSARRALADTLRQRRDMGLSRRSVRLAAIKRIDDPRGVAIRVDIESELAAMEGGS